MAYDPEKKYDAPEGQSIFGVIMHSFFVIPFLIAVFCVLLFASVRILTMEKQTVYDFLDDVKAGGLTKRWQGAFELSKILSNPKLVPTDAKFDQELIAAFRQSKFDDDRVRQYLALAMGRTGKKIFVEPILNELKDEKEANLYSLIFALGLLKDPKSVGEIEKFMEHTEPRIRLVSVIALGNIGDPKSKELLKKRLKDQEPNVQWDSAISLAKLNDLSGKEILINLLDRNYLSKFPEVDVQEQTHVILTTLEAVRKLKDPTLQNSVTRLAQADQNMNVRKLAQEISQP